MNGPAEQHAEPALGKQTPQKLALQVARQPPDELRYLLFLPVDYEQRHDPWPLLLFLHGAGERGYDLDKVKAHGPPKIVETRNDFPFVVLSPQCCPGGEWQRGWDAEILIQLVDHALQEHRVDPERVYLTGLSMGGYGTWRLAARYPDRFAAIVPICGGGDPRDAERLLHVPVWAFHGEQDDVVPLIESERMVRAVQQAGGDAKLTIYHDLAHDSWTRAYDDPDLYAWLLSHTRSGNRR